MPIITISRGSLSGGRALAEELGRKLRLKVVSQQQLIEAASKYGVTPEDYARGIKEPASFWSRIKGSKERYLLAVKATLCELLEPGEGIYHGHAGHFLLEGIPNVLRLRLIAPMEYRIKAAMSELKLDREHAVRHIQEVDEQRVKWVRQVYGADWHDPSLYDLVINLDRVSVEQAVDTAAELSSHARFKSTSESEAHFRDHSVRLRVTAELAHKSPFPADAMDIRVEDGVVTLSGGAFESRRSEVIEFVRQIPGVMSVSSATGTVAVGLPEPTSPADKRARDVMIPAERYPKVYDSVSIRESIVALAASSVQLTDNHLIHPRHVLVLDEHDRLVGVVNRRNLILGLAPRQASDAQMGPQWARSMAAMGTPADFDLLIRWGSLFSSGSLERSARPVGSIMRPLRALVQEDAPLSRVITTMLHHEMDMLPVAEGDKLVGVVLMTEIFDIIAEFVMEQGGKPGQG